MKTTNKFIAVSALVMATGILLAGCQREAISPEANETALDNESVEVIPISVEGAIQCDPTTKITIDPTPGVTAWEANAPIAVYVSGTGANKYVKAPVSSNSIRLSLTSAQARANYAIAPWSCAPASGYTTPEVYYPSSYDMTGKVVTAANSYAPTPMVAINTTTDLKFFHVGGLLRLHVSDVPSGTDKLVVTFTGKNVTGTFSVTNPGTATALATSESDANSTVTFNNLSFTGTDVYLNIPIPAGSYNTLTGITVDASGGTALSVTKAIPASTWGTIGHGNGKKFNVSYTSISGGTGLFHGYEVSKGILKWDDSLNSGAGGYTLTDGEDPLELLNYYRVTSSKNVYYHRFSSDSDDKCMKYRLDGNYSGAIVNSIAVDGLYWSVPTSLSNQSDWYVILNGWTGAPWAGKGGTSVSQANINNTSDDGSIKILVDLSDAIPANGAAADYHDKGLTSWDGGTTIDAGTGTGYQAGLLLAPDGSRTTCPSITNLNASAAFYENVISWSVLKLLIDGGCRFIPASGYHNGSGWVFGGRLGLYWSSTQATTDNAYTLYFHSTNVTIDTQQNKEYYFPVILVR